MCLCVCVCVFVHVCVRVSFCVAGQCSSYITCLQALPSPGAGHTADEYCVGAWPHCQCWTERKFSSVLDTAMAEEEEETVISNQKSPL